MFYEDKAIKKGECEIFLNKKLIDLTVGDFIKIYLLCTLLKCCGYYAEVKVKKPHGNGNLLSAGAESQPNLNV